MVNQINDGSSPFYHIILIIDDHYHKHHLKSYTVYIVVGFIVDDVEHSTPRLVQPLVFLGNWQSLATSDKSRASKSTNQSWNMLEP